ncbi:hypothetical protein ACFWMG_46720 [Streptomyces sp. NPDC127074]|uniref:hypothetical protein n=1 Tax=Streptomyces sp. NPDC127074 TaxID=3347130 RepID=UPI0036610D26
MSEPMSAGWPGPQPDTAAERAQEAAAEPLPGADVAPGADAGPATVPGGAAGVDPGPGTGREEPPEPVSAAATGATVEGVPVPVPELVPEPVPEPPGPAEPAPLGVDRTPTGVPEVDARLDRLADADHLETSGHLEVYEDVHGGLRDTLTALDRRPGPPAPGPRPPSAA